jgi:hypothetical protein
MEKLFERFLQEKTYLKGVAKNTLEMLPALAGGYTSQRKSSGPSTRTNQLTRPS